MLLRRWESRIMGIRRPNKLVLLGAWASIMRWLELSLGEWAGGNYSKSLEGCGRLWEISLGKWAGITPSHWKAAAGSERCILNPRDTEGPQMWKEGMRKPEDNPLQEEWGRSWNGAEPALTLGIEMPGWMITPASCRQEKWLRVFLMTKATYYYHSKSRDMSTWERKLFRVCPPHECSVVCFIFF